MSTFTGPDGITYELTMTAEAEVIPGPLTKIRKICEDVTGDELYCLGHLDVEAMAREILEILNEG